MYPKVCFKHKRINEDGRWKDSLNLNIYMLYIKKPVLVAKCNYCILEDNLNETIKALRRSECAD
jgi:hypothetical protein